MIQSHPKVGARPERSADAAPASVLRALGIRRSALLGQGGESWVYALDGQRVARVNRTPADAELVSQRTALLAELGQSAQRLSFAIPRVHDTWSTSGHLITIEARLPGQPAHQRLSQLSGEARATLVRAYLQAAAALGDLIIDRPWYGDLTGHQAIRTPTLRTYLQQRALHSLDVADPAFDLVDPYSLAAALPEPDQPSFVHLDAFLGNMMAEGEAITAVLDFGASCIIGDRRLDPLAAAAYLDPQITPVANALDQATASAWLNEKGLATLYGPARSWLAAYWSFAGDDLRLQRWCRQQLLP